MGRWYGKKSHSNEASRRLKQLIHIAKGQLGMDDETYRAMFGGLELPTTTTEMTVPQMEVVLEHMKRSGFKVRSKTRQTPNADPSRALALDDESKKIRALWLFLHQLGAVRNPSEEALAAYVKRITTVDALQWISGIQAETLIESLKKWAMRYLPAAVERLAETVRSIPLPDQERARLNDVLAKAFLRQTFDPMHVAWACLTDVLEKARVPA